MYICIRREKKRERGKEERGTHNSTKNHDGDQN